MVHIKVCIKVLYVTHTPRCTPAQPQTFYELFCSLRLLRDCATRAKGAKPSFITHFFFIICVEKKKRNYWEKVFASHLTANAHIRKLFVNLVENSMSLRTFILSQTDDERQTRRPRVEGVVQRNTCYTNTKKQSRSSLSFKRCKCCGCGSWFNASSGCTKLTWVMLSIYELYEDSFDRY